MWDLIEVTFEVLLSCCMARMGELDAHPVSRFHVLERQAAVASDRFALQPAHHLARMLQLELLCLHGDERLQQLPLRHLNKFV